MYFLLIYCKHISLQLFTGDLILFRKGNRKSTAINTVIAASLQSDGNSSPFVGIKINQVHVWAYWITVPFFRFVETFSAKLWWCGRTYGCRKYKQNYGCNWNEWCQQQVSCHFHNQFHSGKNNILMYLHSITHMVIIKHTSQISEYGWIVTVCCLLTRKIEVWK